MTISGFLKDDLKIAAERYTEVEKSMADEGQQGNAVLVSVD